MKSLEELKKQAETEVEADREYEIVNVYKSILRDIANEQKAIKAHEKKISELQEELKKVGEE